MAADDEAAYRTFYQAYYERQWRYLLVVTSGDEDATADALQAALVRLVRHIKVFPSEAVFWSWLTVLARTALSDQRRKARRYLAFLDRFWRQARLARAPSEPADTDGCLLGFLDSELAVLPADERLLLEWKYFEHRSVRAIAEELQTSEKAVESRLVRVRRKLKQALLDDLKHE